MCKTMLITPSMEIAGTAAFKVQVHGASSIRGVKVWGARLPPNPVLEGFQGRPEASEG